MEKYKLSGSIHIRDVDYYIDTPQKYLTGHYILCNRASEKNFVINETVKYFVTRFAEYKTLHDVILEIRREVNSSSRQLEKVCTEFFNFLRKQRVLVKESKHELPGLLQACYRPGDSIGDYIVSAVLSNRKSVDIYRVLHADTGKPFVIKMLNRKKARFPSAFQKQVKLFQQEYRFLKGVRDLCSICRAYALKLDSGKNPYIVMEYVDGRSLVSFLQHHPELRSNDLYKLVENILRAFSQLHSNFLIHGDIHSSNILIRENLDVTIIDLGYSRSVTFEKNELVRHGGVHAYMPPERIAVGSLKKYTRQPDLFSDVYQAGVLVYYALYRQLPFSGFTWEDLSINITNGQLSFPATMHTGDEVPAHFSDAIRKALDKDPAKRFSDIGEMLQAFRLTTLTPMI